MSVQDIRCSMPFRHNVIAELEAGKGKRFADVAELMANLHAEH